jgi:hypothetical protein
MTTQHNVKSVVYSRLAKGGRTHQQIADLVRRVLPNSQTTARSVASMAVDFRHTGGLTTNSEPRGQVKAIVYALLAEGKLTHKAIAERVREAIPTAQTTHKSVASMAVDFKRLPKADVNANFADALAGFAGQ